MPGACAKRDGCFVDNEKGARTHVLGVSPDLGGEPLDQLPEQHPLGRRVRGERRGHGSVGRLRSEMLVEHLLSKQ